MNGFSHPICCRPASAGFALERPLLALALAALTGGNAAAQPAPAYDLQAVVQTALKQHPTLRGAGAQVDAARAQLRHARSGYLPRLGATLGYTELQKDPSFSVSPLGTLVFGERENKQASLAAQLPLFTGGRLEGENRQARAGVTAARSVQERQQQKVVLDATTAYFDVLKARGLVTVSADELKALQSQRDAIARMRERGVATQIDLLRAETAVSAAQEGLIRAKNGEAVAIAALATAMGLPADPSLNVVETGDRGPGTGDGGRRAGDGETGDASPGLPSPVSRLPSSVSDPRAAVEEALRLRPELRQLEANRQAAQGAVLVARSGQWPSIGLYAQYDAARPTFMPRTGTWSAGAALTMNVFDGGATQADVARARAQVTEVEASRDALRNAITLQATQAALNVTSAKERVATTEQAVTTAQEGVRLVRLGYQNGANTITDLLAAQAELTKAQTDRVVAQSDLRIAEAELRFAIGRTP